MPGYLTMIPNGRNASHTFWANTEVLNSVGLQPARTYAELKNQVPILKARDLDTVFLAAKDEWVIQSCLFSMIAGRFCGTGWEKRILNGQAKFTDPDFVAALNFLKTMFDDGVLNRNILGIDYSEGPGWFSAGRAAYMVDGNWIVGSFTTDPDTGQALLSPAKQRNIKIGVFPDIAGTKFNDSSSTSLGAGYGMRDSLASGSAREAAAWQLVKWIGSKEVIGRVVESGGVSSPSRNDINMSALPFEPLQIAMNSIQHANATEIIDAAFIGDIAQQCNVGMAEIGMGTKTPQQVAADIQRVFDAWKARR
jgi:raffinose/stachyose/melibiose transport system substrate-binding protein